MAALATTVAELDDVLVKPLESPFVVDSSHTIKLDDLRLPVERARLRHLWRAMQKVQGTSVTPTPPAPAATSSSSTTPSKKEVLAGWWTQQIGKCSSFRR